MNIAVIGGGISGIMTAWELARAGHRVDLFERNQLMSATSSASTKLLHGGLRYLESGQFSLVREALHERAWWFEAAPHLAKPIALVFPIYRDSPRPRWKIKLGLTLYDRLAGHLGIGRHRWLTHEEVRQLAPDLKDNSLRGGYLFYDGQMDDLELGRWSGDQARAAGVWLHEHTPVERVSTEGAVKIDGETRNYDWVINAAGPWAADLLCRSGISSKHGLDLVRGSHLLLNRKISKGFLLQVPSEQRIFFVLPYYGKALLGTTEIRQTVDEPIECSEQETEYLLSAYNHYFNNRCSLEDVSERFAGVRSLVRSHSDPSKATREYAIERSNRLISVFGGKWTTSRVLAKRIAWCIQ